MGYLDHDGKMVIPAIYKQAWDFSEGLAAVCLSDESCFYIDRSGSPELKQFRAWWPFTDGLAVIGQDYIDKRGRVIAPYSREKRHFLEKSQ